MTTIAVPTVDWPNVIAKAKEGCDLSLGIIAGQVHRYLLVVAAARIGHDMRAKFDAADIVQISMLEAWFAIHEFRGSTEAEILRWLRMIVINTLVDETRRFSDVKARDPKREIGLHRVSPTMVGRYSTESWLMSQSETDMELAQAVNRLSPRLRRVIEARNRDGLDFAEIAIELGCTPAAVRKVWYRALKQLRGWLEPSE